MKYFVSHLLESRKEWGTIIHLGAGGCSELQLYRKMEPVQLILVEAHPRFADDLARKVNVHKGEKVIQAAVMSHTGQVSLQVLNNFSENGVLPLGKLLTYFPNLRMTERVDTRALSLQTILEDVRPDSNMANLLIVEVAGLELDVLGATDEQYLHKFTHILVRGSDEVLYEGGGSGQALKEYLNGVGFELGGVHAEARPPFLNWLFTRNDDAVRERRYLLALDDCVARNQVLTEEKNALETQFAELTASFEAKLQQLQSSNDDQLQVMKSEHQTALAAALKEVEHAKNESLLLAQQSQQEAQNERTVNAHLQAELVQSQAAREEVVQRLQTLEMQLTMNVQERNNEQQAYQRSLTELQQAADQRTAIYLQQIDELVQRINQLVAERSQQDEQIEELTVEFNRNSAEKLELQQQLVEAGLRNVDLERRLAEISEVRQLQEDQLASAERQKSELAEHMNAMLAERRHQESLLSDYMNKASALDEKCQELEELRAQSTISSNQVIQELADNLNDVQRQKMRQEEMLEAVQLRVQGLQTEVRQAQDTYAEAKMTFDHEVIALTQALNHAVHEKSLLEAQCKEALKSIESSTMQAARQEQEFIELRQQLAQVEQDRNIQLDSQQQRQAYITQLQLARDAQERHIDSLNERIAQLGGEAAQLQAQISSMQQALQVAAAVASERDDLLTAQDLHNRLAADTQLQVERLQADNALLNQTKQDLLHQLTTAQFALTEMTQERSAAVQRVTELEYMLGDQSETQQLLDAEFIKAQAQIALLRDVLLREPGL